MDLGSCWWLAADKADVLHLTPSHTNRNELASMRRAGRGSELPSHCPFYDYDAEYREDTVNTSHARHFKVLVLFEGACLRTKRRTSQPLSDLAASSDARAPSKYIHITPWAMQ